jgi:hypothetical protein
MKTIFISFPRIVIGLVFFIAPGFIVTTLIFTIFFPDTYNINYLLKGGGPDWSQLEILVLNIMLWALSYFVYKYTPWKKIVDTVAPRDLYESREQ